METLLLILVAFIGTTVRRLIDYQTAIDKVAKKGEVFSNKVYLRNNAIAMLISYLVTIVFVLSVPALLHFFNFDNTYNYLVCFGTGFSSQEVFAMFRGFINSKLGKYGPIVLLIVFSACKTQEQRDFKKLNKILARNPSWVTSKIDTVFSEIVLPSVNANGVEEIKYLAAVGQVDSLNALIDSILTSLIPNPTIEQQAKGKEFKQSVKKTFNNSSSKGCSLPLVVKDTLGIKVTLQVINGKLFWRFYKAPDTLKVATSTKSTTLKDKVEVTTWLEKYYKQVGIWLLVLLIAAVFVGVILKIIK
jgi:hypothetical protein